MKVVFFCQRIPSETFLQVSRQSIFPAAKEWSMMLTAIKIYVVLGGALFSGGILAGLFPKKKPFFIILITSITVGLGLLCRYLLEFGEVSNTYNFTVPNTLLHVGIFLALTDLTYICYFRKNKFQLVG